MSEDIQDIRDKIIDAAAKEVVFDGWTVRVLEHAAINQGYETSMVRAVFPDVLPDALAHFASMIDRRMMARLKSIDIEYLRIRDRIKQAVMARIDVLENYREAEKKALAYWSVPPRQARALRILWRSADMIWDWAGDTATDYNRYTKRGLLSGVMASTILVWLNREGDKVNRRVFTESFLDRRIDNVMQIGKTMGMVKNAPDLLKKAGQFMNAKTNRD